MAKEEESDMDPLDYRVLLMLSTAYRTYAKTRLEHLHPWVDSWALEEIYAGIEGQGANDAAYATAIEIEWCRLQGMEYSGGAADIYKCFDQTQRTILYKVMEAAGMPRGVLRAYREFQEALTIRNTVTGGLGEPYRKPTSIPQGDPISMMATSLLLRAWVVQMKLYAVKPRILADDLQLLCTGDNHLENFEYGFTKTHKHIEDLGARLAPNKSMTFSSNEVSRRWLREHKWRRVGTMIAVITDGRDLGAHLNAAEGRMYGTTLTKRLEETAKEVESLNRAKAPYPTKAKIIRAAKLPKGLYGCEVSPINESALRTFRTAITKTLTYTTDQRSADLTFATASHGPDLDPEVAIAMRRAVAVRRYISKSEANERMARKIIKNYGAKREPGVYEDEEQLRQKELGGEPTSIEKAQIRKQCNPRGPIGLFLETLHLQAATMDGGYTIRQWNQPKIELHDGPAQQLGPMMSRMVARNRTKRNEDSRFETQGLQEIDVFATTAKHSEEVKEEEDKVILRLMQTGSNWTKALTAKTGKSETDECELCGEKETKDHIWHCKRLNPKRREVDLELAEADPEDFTPAMRMGVACAMNADPRRTYWGKACNESWCKDTRRRYGCIEKQKMSDTVREVMDRFDQQGAEEVPAREGMAAIAKMEEGEETIKPKISQRVKGEAPEKPNVYSDGSLKNTKGYFWQLGGAGVWWPGRKAEDLTQEEESIAEYKEEPGGLMLWCSFNADLNSSTRCELAAAILALLPPRPINIGIDNATVVGKGNEIIQHARRREEEKRTDERGRPLLGGTKSKLYRKTPYKRKWAQTRDGDLWQLFEKLVKQRGPETVKITKVKGHATEEMVEQGKVEAEDKAGNDMADQAADQGATKSQGRLQVFASLYAWRQGRYRKMMARIQQFIVEVKKEEKKLKQEDNKVEDPFERQEVKKVTVQKHLKYVEDQKAKFLQMNPVRKEWCEDEGEEQYIRKVRSFLETNGVE